MTQKRKYQKTDVVYALYNRQDHEMSDTILHKMWMIVKGENRIFLLQKLKKTEYIRLLTVCPPGYRTAPLWVLREEKEEKDFIRMHCHPCL